MVQNSDSYIVIDWLVLAQRVVAPKVGWCEPGCDHKEVVCA